MSSLAAHTTATIIPSLRYRDAHAAIDWLCRAFGFEKQSVHAGDNGRVQHAQSVFGNGMIMLGSGANASAWASASPNPTKSVAAKRNAGA